MKLFAMGLDQNERSITTFIDINLHKVSDTESISSKQDGLVCNACKLRYRIEDDIPIMLIDEAVKIE